MNPRTLNVGFVSFAYGGNGGISSEHPNIREWMLRASATARADKRVGKLGFFTLSDTPITMTRNKSVLEARQRGIDVLVMVDSDQHPDCELGRDTTAKPFWDTSFDFLCRHYERGPVMVGAPYCGPPPIENPYPMRWCNKQSHNPDSDMQLEMYSREEAAYQTGILEAAAMPTGLTMWDLRCFEHMTPPWFYYEWRDEFQADKASTEDVTATRDLALIGVQTLGYNPVFCNWDAWAGHWKPKCVRKPQVIMASEVGAHMQAAFRRGAHKDERMTTLDCEIPASLNGRAPINAIIPNQKEKAGRPRLAKR